MVCQCGVAVSVQEWSVSACLIWRLCRVYLSMLMWK